MSTQKETICEGAVETALKENNCALIPKISKKNTALGRLIDDEMFLLFIAAINIKVEIEEKK